MEYASEILAIDHGKKKIWYHDDKSHNRLKKKKKIVSVPHHKYI